MGDRARASVVTAMGVFAVVLGLVWLHVCGSATIMAAADGAPIIVKNQKLEVILLSDDPTDVWVSVGNDEYQPSKSQRKRLDLVVLATKSNGTGCQNQPFRGDWVKVWYGTPASGSTPSDVAKTVLIHVAGKKFKAKFPGAQGAGTKVLEFTRPQPNNDFLYLVQAANANPNDKFECTTNASTPMVANVFEVN